MKNFSERMKPIDRMAIWGVIWSLMLTLVAPVPAAWAGTTDIAQVPIFTTTTDTTEVKPNVMVMVDDSGSMDSDYMPDAANDFSGGYGYVSSQCNGIYYNPSITYYPPVDATGASYANSSFTAAWKDGYNTSGGTANLSNNYTVDTVTTGTGAFYYTYSGTQTTAKLQNYYSTTSTFYIECNLSRSSASTKFTLSVPVGVTAQTNFANWYSYYRTRILTMKTATGRAFQGIDQHFRVGYATLNGNNGGTDLLNISDFDATQKTKWYSNLYKTKTGNSTPLRATVAIVGRMFAGEKPTLSKSTTTDPLQFSCQQNYLVAATDGYWNESDSTVTKLGGGAFTGSWDSNLPRPYNDGAASVVTTDIPYVTTQTVQISSSPGFYTLTWRQSINQIGSACTVPAASPPNLYGGASMPSIPSGTKNYIIGVGNSTSSPSASQCAALGTTVAGNSQNAWFCRGGGTSGNNPPTVSSLSTTDPQGTTWYIVTSLTGNTNTSKCKDANALSSSIVAGQYWACPQIPSASGTSVTSTVQLSTETVVTSGGSELDLYQASQSTRQVTTNGVPGPIGSMSPSTPSFVYTSTISVLSGGTVLDVVTPWVTSATTVSCVPNASVPSAGTTTSTIASSVVTGGSSTTSTVSTGMPIAGTPSVTSVITASGTSLTLADVTSYYYVNNLRNGVNCTGPVIAPATTASNLCLTNKVPPYLDDTATWQHMTTFTLGVGTRGRMAYSKSYKTDTSGDYYDVKVGATADSSHCPWRDTLTVTNGQCNWPKPASNQPETIDDLWHAAVNGRGAFIGASNPADIYDGLSSTLNYIQNVPQPGTAAAAATTNPKITSINNYQFSSYFLSLYWSGELIRQTINLNDGSVPSFNPSINYSSQPGAFDWSAAVQLDAQAYTTRKIYTSTSSGASRVTFTWTDLTAAGLQNNFTAPNITTSPPAYPTQLTSLSQYCTVGSACLSATATNTINVTVSSGGAAGEALVRFLSGDQSNAEVDPRLPDNTKFYRYRFHVLGDIVSAQPQYVTNGTTSIVLSAANDGMLHAFDAGTGNELWAYIPNLILSRLYKLADKNYKNNHQYLLEGTPVISTICPASTCTTPSQFKTIVVGGLAAGGAGYYALDITDPSNPKVLWEFKDANMGYSHGKPQIAKMSDGTWVVLLTSGYDNCPRSTGGASCIGVGTSGDGQGRLYVLNANTGAQVGGASTPISTGAGSASTPSGLAQITARVDTNNVIQAVYGGDLLGNLWRFTVAPGNYTVQKVAQFADASGVAQPITAKPVVTSLNSVPIIMVGTGRYLGVSDVGSTQIETFYAVKDNVTTTPYTSIRSDISFIGKTAISGTCPTGANVDVCQPGTTVRTIRQNTGVSTDSLINKNGWYVDLPTGEMDFTEAKLVGGVLVFSTSIPTLADGGVCGSTGVGDSSAFGYIMDASNGGAVATTSGVAGLMLGAGISTAPIIEVLPNGVVVAKFRLSSGVEVRLVLRFSSLNTPTRRVSWRELFTD